MKKEILRIFKLYIAVLGTFLFVQKPLFMFFNHGRDDASLSVSELWRIYSHGIQLDTAATGYLVALPTLLIAAGYFIRRFNTAIIIKPYLAFISLVISLAAVADASLYEFWEFKLDNTVFFYVTDPKNAFASVSVWYVVWRTLFIAFLTYIIYKVYVLAAFYEFFLFYRFKTGQDRRRSSSPRHNIIDRWYVAMPMFLISFALIFVGMRGVDIFPVTPSKAHYSNVKFFNHCAINPIFNVVYSLSHQSQFRKEYRYYTDEEVEAVVKPLFPTAGESECLLKTERPNILFILIESMGATFIESLHTPDNTIAAETGELSKDVAVELSKLMDTGICFDQCYCGSVLTDRGVVCALSGYLGQPSTSIMRYSRKIATLPALPKTLKRFGYDTQVLYAGDMTFFNMSEYFHVSGHDKLVSEQDFTPEQRSSQWGVPDHIACEWLAADIIKRSESSRPFYTTFLTLSSHAPFDVPYQRMKDKVMNGFAYTDKCIGDLIRTLQASPAWDNLLVVITADHGFPLRPHDAPNFPLVPFLMTGGAVADTVRISTPVSQTDIAATVLGQLGMPHDDFPFSRDVLADTYTRPFAFNTFNNGFNLRDTLGTTVFDNVTKSALSGHDEQRELIGKSILQYLYNDIDKR